MEVDLPVNRLVVSPASGISINVPPELFLITRNATSLDDAELVGDRIRKTRSELMSFVNPIVDSQLYKSQDFAKRVQFKRTFESETADSFRDIQRDVALLEAEERGRAEVGFVSYQRQVKALMTRGYSREEAKNILK